jgi:hypothetical protein
VLPVSHASICQCSECFARKVGGQVVATDLSTKWEEIVAFATPADAIAGGVPAEVFKGEGAPPDVAEDPSELPSQVIGCQVVQSVTIKQGTTHALVLWNMTTHEQWIIYWERNATGSGIGHWAVIAIEPIV